MQSSGDFDETFAPALSLKAWVVLLAFASAEDAEMLQYDYRNAYLQAKLDRPIFLEPPQGYKRNDGKVWLLLKSIYGLKQAGHEWHVHLRDVLVKIGFVQMKVDRCIFVFVTSNGKIILAVYVDDMLAIVKRADLPVWKRLLAQLEDALELTGAGEVRLMLGIAVERDRARRTITLSQSGYIERIVADHMPNAKPLGTPWIQRSDAERNTIANERCDVAYPYARVIGKLAWLARISRPDIAAATFHAARNVKAFDAADIADVERIIRYLAGTAGCKLVIDSSRAKSESPITVYTDASWASDHSDRRSITGYLVFVGGALVSWCSKKQSRVALSTAESELVAIAEGVREALWIRQLLAEIGAGERGIAIITDSMAALHMVRSGSVSDRNKHIEIRHRFVSELIAEGVATIEHARSADQLADFLTKPYSVNGMDAVRRKLFTN
jgi:hypothetical protein